MVYLFTFALAAASFGMMIGFVVGPGQQASRLAQATPAFVALVLLLAGLCSFFGYSVGVILESALRVF